MKIHWSIKSMICSIMICCISCKKEEKSTELSTAYPIVFEEEMVQQWYAHYLKIHMALVKGTPKEVQKEARALAALIPEHKSYSVLKATTRLVYLTKDLKKQRDFFVGMTAAMENVIQSSSIKSGQIYKQFCPMAFHGEGGYWLSSNEEIYNPYYGDEMLHCGYTTEVIK